MVSVATIVGLTGPVGVAVGEGVAGPDEGRAVSVDITSDGVLGCNGIGPAGVGVGATKEGSGVPNG